MLPLASSVTDGQEGSALLTDRGCTRQLYGAIEWSYSTAQTQIRAGRLKYPRRASPGPVLRKVPSF